MKNILYTICILLIFHTIVQAKHVIISKENKGPLGYKNVKETHENNNHVLICWDPGELKCKFVNTTPIIVGSSGNTYQTEQIENIVLDYISSGQNNGRILFDGIVIVWESSIQKLKIDIYDEQNASTFNNLH